MPLVGPSKYHRTLDGKILTRERERIGLSQKEFAAKCKWSQQYQSQIEEFVEHEVHVSITNKILLVINEGVKKCMK
jgi:transcriptional regulator with XRE-family HTH domain